MPFLECEEGAPKTRSLMCPHRTDGTPIIAVAGVVGSIIIVITTRHKRPYRFICFKRGRPVSAICSQAPITTYSVA